jgi:hypothetical protein
MFVSSKGEEVDPRNKTCLGFHPLVWAAFRWAWGHADHDPSTVGGLFFFLRLIFSFFAVMVSACEVVHSVDLLVSSLCLCSLVWY